MTTFAAAHVELVFKVVSISSVEMTAVDPSSVVMLASLIVITVHLARECVKTDANIADASEDVEKHVRHAWSRVSGTANTVDAPNSAANHVIGRGVTSRVGNVYTAAIFVSVYAESLVQLNVEYVTGKK